jgi:hypothetical protein
MDLSESLAFVCAEHFLQIDPGIIQYTKPVDMKICTGKLSANQVQCASWLAKGGKFFTIFRLQQNTIVYCHVNKMMYYASPNVQLPLQIPVGYAFLAQTTKDNGVYPRLLVLDIVYPVIPDPMVRGMELRKFAECFPSTCHVQWSGDLMALRKFLSNGLPHEVEGIVSMHEPLCFTKELY